MSNKNSKAGTAADSSTKVENTSVNQPIANAVVSRRFSVTIHDDNGEMSMDICDHNTMTQTNITAEDFGNYKNAGFNVYTIAKILIDIAKKQYLSIVDKRSANGG